jgi:hypothetical protein
MGWHIIWTLVIMQIFRITIRSKAAHNHFQILSYPWVGILTNDQ